MPINAFENKRRLTIADIVSKFYDGTVKKIFTLKPLIPTKTNDIDVYKLSEYPLFISGLTFGILTLILIFDFWSNGFTSKALPAIYFVGLIILLIGAQAIVTAQYILNDWGKEVSFDNEGLIIKQKGKEVKIEKSEIAQIVVVENDSSRYLRYYKYARIKTKDGKAFIVTSFIMKPMDIVNKLKVHHKEESVFFLPTINFDIQSKKEKEKIRRNREKKRKEFLENFKDYEDSKLRQIIGDKKGYADYAIEAAAEILKRRTQQ